MRRKEFIDTILMVFRIHLIYIIIIGLTIENLSYTHIITRTGISSRQLILQNYGI